MILFRIVWGIDAIAAMIVLYFFFVGLADGTVSSFNIAIWAIILAILGVIMFGSIWLRSHNQPVLALILVLVLAIPVLLYLAFFLILLGGNGRWN